MLIFGTVGLVSRLLPYSSGAIALFRSLIGFIVIALFMLIARKTPDIRGIRQNALLLLLSGALLGVNWIAFFEACKRTTVQTATLSYYLAPIILVCLAPVFFAERIGLKKALCIILALVGMVFVSGVIDGGAEGVTYSGILIGVLAALLYACVVISNKKMKEIEPLTKTAAQFLVSAAVLLPYVVFTGGFEGVSFEVDKLVALLVIGTVHTGIAYVLYFSSTSGLSANTVAIYSYVDPIVALIASAAVLGETLTPLMIVGGVLIVGSSVVSEVKFNFRKREESADCRAAENDEN